MAEINDSQPALTIKAELRELMRGFLEEMIEQEATAALGRSRYQRVPAS
jgi:hypothetical protein